MLKLAVGIQCTIAGLLSAGAAQALARPLPGFTIVPGRPPGSDRLRSSRAEASASSRLLSIDLFAVSDDRVLATVLRLEQVFRDLYPINDPERGVAGLAIGRYPEDRYDGTEINGIGHPWPFLTANFALFYHRLAAVLKTQGQFAVTELIQPLFAALPLHELPLAGSLLKAGSCAFDQVYMALKRKGDSYLLRVQSAKTADGDLSEQNDRMTGRPLSAPNLSMSYAAYVVALKAR